MNSFAFCQQAVNERGLVHIEQTTPTSCARACLRMLTDDEFHGTHLPDPIPTEDLFLYAARMGVYLEPRSLLTTSWDCKVYMIQHNQHWFLLQVTDFQVIIYDPMAPKRQVYPIDNFPMSTLANVTYVFTVHFARTPELGEPLV